MTSFKATIYVRFYKEVRKISNRKMSKNGRSGFSAHFAVPSSFCFTFHILNIAIFSSSVVVNFVAKPKAYLYMHGSNDSFPVLQFLLKIPSTRRKSAGSLS